MSLSGTNGTSGSGGGWTPPSVEELQAMLPQYEVESILGRGGMGAVYRGKQAALERPVAIKILPQEAAADDDLSFVERFKLEARAMAGLDHPAIISVYDFGQTPSGLLYFVMEFVDGMDIQKYIELSGGQVEQDHAVAIVSHVLDALDYAHSKGIVHRDIKPANVLINREGKVKIADFGLAKKLTDENDAPVTGLTMSNVALGTPDFIAPEALDPDATPDHRADLYAVGIMLYQMLTGKLPRGIFKLPSEVDNKIDPRIDEILALAMEGDPAERFQSATEFRIKLDELTSAPIQKITPEAHTAEVEPPAEKFNFTEPGLGKSESARRHPPRRTPVKQKGSTGLMIGIGAAVLVIGGVLLLMLAKGGKEEEPPEVSKAINPFAEEEESKEPTKSEPSQIAISTTQGNWPKGPQYASAGGFRAWSLKPDEDFLNLSPLQDITDVKQIYVHANGWIVLRENGDTISSNGHADRRGIRRISSSFGQRFALIGRNGKVEVFDQAVPVSGDVRINSLSNVSDLGYTSGTEWIALLNDGSLQTWGPAFDETNSKAAWKDRPSLPSNVKGVALSYYPGSVALKLDDGSFRAWSNERGSISVSDEFSANGIEFFVMTRKFLAGLPFNEEQARIFQFEDGNTINYGCPHPTTAIYRSGNTQFAVLQSGSVWIQHMENSFFTDSIQEWLRMPTNFQPDKIWLHENKETGEFRILWFDPDKSKSLTSAPAKSDNNDALVVTTEWNDVLDSIIRNPSFSEGEWKPVKGALSVSVDGRGGIDDAVRGVTASPVEACDIRCRFSARSRKMVPAISLLFPTPAGGASYFLFDGSMKGGLERSPGKAPPNVPNSQESLPFAIGDGKQHELVLHVSQDAVEAWLDGKKQHRVAVEDWKNVDQGFLHSEEKPLIGIRAESADAIFHSLEIRRQDKNIDGLVADGEWQDALQQIGNTPDFTTPEWEYKDGVLKAEQKIKAANAVRGIHMDPVQAIDVRMKYMSRKETQESISIYLPTPEGGTSVFVGEGQQIVGLEYSKFGTEKRRPKEGVVKLPEGLLATEGISHEFQVSIRGGELSASIDGNPVFQLSSLNWAEVNQRHGYPGETPLLGVRVGTGGLIVSSFDYRIPSQEAIKTTGESNTKIGIPELEAFLTNHQENRRTQLGNLLVKYQSALSRAEESAIKAGELERVEAIQTAIERAESLAASIEELSTKQTVKSLPPLPPLGDKAPNELKRLRGIFDTEVAKIEDGLRSQFESSLDELKIKLTKANRIEDARKVEQFRTYLANPSSDNSRTTAFSDSSQSEPQVRPTPRLVESNRIWDQAPFNAYTDLILHSGSWLCVFREADVSRTSPEGSIRVLGSTDGIRWNSLALIADSEHDLRDPKISVTPDGLLMITSGAKTSSNRNFIQSKTWFSSDAGRSWTSATNVGDSGFWLWRSVWHDGFCYNMGYSVARANPPRLYRSKDGKNFESFVPALNLEKTVGENGMVFQSDGTALCLFRHDLGDKKCVLGKASPPYQSWTWNKLDQQIGGPNLIELPSGRILAAGRLFDGGKRTSLLWLDSENGNLEECLQLPSGGETGYPGLVWKDGHLWVSYYSSHEGKPSIYVAKIAFD